jgi:TldD protein
MNYVPDAIRKIQSVLEEAVHELEKSFPYAQASFSEDEGLAATVSNKEIRVSEVAPRRGAVIAAWNGRYSSEIGISDVTQDSIRDVVRTLKAKIAPDPDPIHMDPGESWTGDYFSTFEEDPFSIPLQDKLDHMKLLQTKLAAMSPRVVSSSIRYSERVVRKIYVNRSKRLFQQLLYTACTPAVIVSDKKQTKILHGGNGYQKGFEITRISDEKLAALVLETENLLHSKPVAPGVYEVIGGPNIAGVIAHEAFGHGVEADMFLKKRAKAVEYLGKEVASPLVNLYDSPAFPGLSGSYFFDDEGQKASETAIIEHGILKTVLTDHRSATMLKIPRTANGRRQAFTNKVYARMSNTYFAPGESKLDDMISSIECGLYMPKGSNGMEDPKNWGIQVESPYAIEIKNGKLTDTIYSPIVITGFVPDLLKSISMTGDKLGFEGMGICQKGHKEQVMVAIGGPNLKMIARVG